MVSLSVRDRHEGGDDPESAAGPVKGAHIITESIEVGVPAQEAFAMWTRYHSWHDIFKRESAEGKPGRVRVTSKIGPSERHWDAEVSETEPGHRIDWRSRGGIRANGTTTFHRLDDRLTKVMVEIEYHPSGLVEAVGNLLRMQRRRVRKNLRLFKNYAELHGSEEGE